MTDGDYSRLVSAGSSLVPTPYFGSQYERYSPSHSSLQNGSDWPAISTSQIRRGTRRPHSAQLVSAVSCQVRSISTHLPVNRIPPRARPDPPIVSLFLRRPLSVCTQLGRRGLVDDEVVFMLDDDHAVLPLRRFHRDPAIADIGEHGLGIPS